MRSYQSVLILKPDIEESRIDEALAKIGEFIKSNGGAILKVEKWGKKRLAYRVKKNRFGVYLNLYHTLEPSGVIDLEKKYKLFDLIIKFMEAQMKLTTNNNNKKIKKINNHHHLLNGNKLLIVGKRIKRKYHFG